MPITEFVVSGGQEFEHGALENPQPYFVGAQGRLDGKRDLDLSDAQANLEQVLYAAGTLRRVIDSAGVLNRRVISEEDS
jgi:hypothetical protein